MSVQLSDLVHDIRHSTFTGLAMPTHPRDKLACYFPGALIQAYSLHTTPPQQGQGVLGARVGRWCAVHIEFDEQVQIDVFIVDHYATGIRISNRGCATPAIARVLIEQFEYYIHDLMRHCDDATRLTIEQLRSPLPVGFGRYAAHLAMLDAEEPAPSYETWLRERATDHDLANTKGDR